MTHNTPPLIVLLTDFGNDPYAGIMKGRIYQINPFVKITTLSNHIQNHNIRQAAFILLKSYRYFPPRSIFLVVVDPGVGSSRQAIAIKSGEHYFIGPDNGVFWPIISKIKDANIVSIPISNGVSKTFHGRDVFAPAAAILSQNYLLNEIGKESILQTSLKFHWDPSNWIGEVIYIDHFGNIITNIPNALNLDYNKQFLVSTERISQQMLYKRNYYEGSSEKPFLVANSFNTLEIALRNGKASERIDVLPSERIQVSLL